VNELLQFFSGSTLRLLTDPRNVLDIVLIAAFFYGVLTLIHGTTGITILRGIAILYLVGAVLSNVFGLTTVSWLLRNSLPLLSVALVVLFAPELRRALEQVGRPSGVLTRPATNTPFGRTIEVLATSARRLSELGWGALIVLERDTGLGEYIETGTRLDAALSQELLLNVFFPHAPLHDGAAVVRGERIVAAGCLLPLTDTGRGAGHLGTRHRAAIGISERTDAVCVVVSEETSQISIANNGRMVRNLDDEKLRKVLQVIYRPSARRPRLLFLEGPARGAARWLTRPFGRHGEAHPHA
jgi:diadenylate cyclase